MGTQRMEPDKVERDTLMRHRRTLRAAIKHLLACGTNPAHHDQMMCVLTNRSAGHISEDECDQHWRAFVARFALDG